MKWKHISFDSEEDEDQQASTANALYMQMFFYKHTQPFQIDHFSQKSVKYVVWKW